MIFKLVQGNRNTGKTRHIMKEVIECSNKNSIWLSNNKSEIFSFKLMYERISKRKNKGWNIFTSVLCRGDINSVKSCNIIIFDSVEELNIIKWLNNNYKYLKEDVEIIIITNIPLIYLSFIYNNFLIKI